MPPGSLHSTALTTADTSGLIHLTTYLEGARLEQNGKNDGYAIPDDLGYVESAQASNFVRLFK